MKINNADLEQRTTLWPLKISVPHLMIRSAVKTSASMAFPTAKRVSGLFTNAGISSYCWNTETGCCM